MFQAVVTIVGLIIDLIQALGIFMIGITILATLGMIATYIDESVPAPIKVEISHSVAAPKFKNPFKK